MSTSPYRAAPAAPFAVDRTPAGKKPPWAAGARAAPATPATPASGFVAGVAVEGVEGVVESIKIFNGWGLANIRTKDAALTVTGAVVAELREGMDYAFAGRIKNHPKYGMQLDAVAAHPVIRPNARAIARFLSANFDGVGERTAAKVVEQIVKEGGAPALEALRQKLLREPWAVAEDLARFGKKGSYSSEEREASVTAFVQRDLATRLGGVHGLRDGVLKALAGYLARGVAAAGGVVGMRKDAGGARAPHSPVEASWALLSRDPYEPIRRVPGYGFVSADTIGRMVNIATNAAERLAALVAHALAEHCDRHGHVYLTAQQLEGSILKLDARVDIEQAIQEACDRGTIAIEGAGHSVEPDELFEGISGLNPHEPRYYKPQLLRAEVKLARKVAQMLQVCEPLIPGALAAPDSPSAARTLQTIRAAAKSIYPNGLDASQEEGLRRIMSSPVRLHTLTAGPGCGKTALMEVLVKALPGKTFVFCTPTGKAAKVLSNRLAIHGKSANTIHSTLKGAGPGEFEVNEDDPLIGDVLVVDESSMPDLATFEAVLAAANHDMHVVLLGDPRQLPSIQPGRVLMDLLEIDGIDHNQLTTVHRNSGGILDVVNEIDAGQLNTTNRESVSFSGELGDASTEFHGVMGAYLQAVAERGIENVMLMMPRRQGDIEVPGWNATYANHMLRGVCNPGAPKVPGTPFQVRDRVVIRKNMTLEQPDTDDIEAAGKGQATRRRGTSEPDADNEKNSVRVVNGDTGAIKGFVLDAENPKSGSPKWVTVDLDDGRRVHLPGSALSDLALAYAMTVHSAQGSEYQAVIMVVTPGSPAFMNRNMAYTGASRARKVLSIWGEDNVLRRVAATPLPPRNSALVERIQYELGTDDDTPMDCSQPRQAA